MRGDNGQLDSTAFMGRAVGNLTIKNDVISLINKTLRDAHVENDTFLLLNNESLTVTPPVHKRWYADPCSSLHRSHYPYQVHNASFQLLTVFPPIL